jgi:hypothetical protein
MQCDNGTLMCRCGRYTQQEDNIVRKVSTFSQRSLDWYDGQEGFALRSERAIEELKPSNMVRLRQWMFSAFEAGRASRNAE